MREQSLFQRRGQTDEQTKRQTDRQMDRQTDGQTDGWTDKQTVKRTSRQTLSVKPIYTQTSFLLKNIRVLTFASVKSKLSSRSRCC